MLWKEKEMCSSYQSLCKSKKHLKLLCAEMEPFPCPFIHSAYVYWMQILCQVLLWLSSTPKTNEKESSCFLGAYFPMGGDRQETCKQIILCSDKYYEENKWARECLGQGAGRPFQGGDIWADNWMMRKRQLGKIQKLEYSVQKEWHVQRPWGRNELGLSKD